MPVYTYRCPDCESRFEEVRTVDRRHDKTLCACGSQMKRAPELFKVSTFEPYYDEGLGCDVHSSEDKRAIMKDLDLIEAGDTVHGARNFDDKNPNLVEKTPPKGIRRKEKKEVDDTIVQTVDAKGEVLTSEPFHELSEA